MIHGKLILTRQDGSVTDFCGAYDECLDMGGVESEAMSPFAIIRE